MSNKKEPVIVFENVPDIVTIEDIYKYSANITLGLDDRNDFYIVINFKNLNEEDSKILLELFNQPNRLKFKSKLIEKENYNITHIVVTEIKYNFMSEMTWECLSDDPELYNLIIQ